MPVRDCEPSPTDDGASSRARPVRPCTVRGNVGANRGPNSETRDAFVGATLCGGHIIGLVASNEGKTRSRARCEWVK